VSELVDKGRGVVLWAAVDPFGDYCGPAGPTSSRHVNVRGSVAFGASKGHETTGHALTQMGTSVLLA